MSAQKNKSYQPIDVSPIGVKNGKLRQRQGIGFGRFISLTLAGVILGLLVMLCGLAATPLRSHAEPVSTGLITSLSSSRSPSGEQEATKRHGVGTTNLIDDLISDIVADANSDRLKKSRHQRPLKQTLRFGRRSDPWMMTQEQAENEAREIEAYDRAEAEAAAADRYYWSRR